MLVVAEANGQLLEQLLLLLLLPTPTPSSYELYRLNVFLLLVVSPHLRMVCARDAAVPSGVTCSSSIRSDLHNKQRSRETTTAERKPFGSEEPLLLLPRSRIQKLIDLSISYNSASFVDLGS